VAMEGGWAGGTWGGRERALGFYPLILCLIPNDYISPHIYGEDPT
jgi:hypothetical protein